MLRTYNRLVQQTLYTFVMSLRAFRLVACTGMVLMSLASNAYAARPPPQRGVVEGTLTYRERIALPSEAVAEVSLLDTSRADAAATVIARTNLLPEVRQVPLPFTLRYDPSRIEPTHTYAVRAVIRSGGRTLFTTDTAYPVITQGHQSRVELNLVNVGDRTPRNALLGTRWLLEDLGSQGVLDRLQATLEFAEGDRVGGHASCNRFFGTAEVSGGSISFGLLGATRMSCSEAVMRQERRYLRALEGAERFTLDGSVLLIYTQGLDKPLRFTRLDRGSLKATGSFQASGTEPFWSLGIDHAGLRFTTPDNPAGVRFPIRLLTVIGTSTQWDGKTGNAGITARIRPGACSDGMSERVLTYEARVRLNGAPYQGCAEATSEGTRFHDVRGEWMIVDHRIPGISALTAAEAARWHGRRVRLGTTMATSATNTCQRPVYRYRIAPAKMFLQAEFRIAPADLGLQAMARLALTEVFCTKARWASPGGLLLGVSEGGLYTVWDGVFFELRRLAHNRGDE